jgi:nucleotide-binding universal stress UspA family protein
VAAAKLKSTFCIAKIRPFFFYWHTACWVKGRSIQSLQDRRGLSMNYESTPKLETGEIVAAVDFDDRAGVIIQTAAQLSRLRGLPLRLVHAISPESLGADEPWPEDLEGLSGLEWRALARSSSPGDLVDGISPLAIDSVSSHVSNLALAEVRDAERRLLELAQRFANESKNVRVEATFGYFPDTFLDWMSVPTLEKAEDNKPVLFIVGAPTNKPGFMKNKLKPVQRLMAKSRVPVLVLSDQVSHLQLSKRPLRLLVADDLSEDTQKVMVATKNLVTALGLPVEVQHIHVEPVATAGWALSPEYRLVVWPGISVEDRLINDHHEALKDQLRYRGKDLRAAVESLGGHYHIELWHGGVAEELQRAVQVLQADVSIFGQHHFLHRRPVGFGQMPFTSMLEVESAVLIAPS